LDELIGPPQTRPGELHDRYSGPVPAGFLDAARSRGIAISLALSVVCERQLAIGDLGADEPSVERLDARAREMAPTAALASPFADYARALLAAISGRPVGDAVDGPPVISMRLACRLRVVGDVVRLDGEAIESALWWELAATLSGSTMLEWALREAARDRAVYGSPTAGHAAAASSTAR
jgi:hypothetical protein